MGNVPIGRSGAEKTDDKVQALSGRHHFAPYFAARPSMKDVLQKSTVAYEKSYQSLMGNVEQPVCVIPKNAMEVVVAVLVCRGRLC
ncbi:hypothetical protein Y032_0018g3607 [Ancylostoma ceylanicum]|uniref:Uncharacterized protein n=1 Tax=Ancylostoma ceylanicum TaxID=53326 RepID=A0A016V4H1_9BILA|nr:hypothetical protein Y032_0018g3607 [Ancylostoma ceylanicum]